MVTRFISSGATKEEFDAALDEANTSGSQVVLEVHGVPTAMIIPLSPDAQSQAFREAFGRFWEARKAHLREHPPVEMTEDEELEWALSIQREIRAELRAEDETAVGATDRRSA